MRTCKLHPGPLSRKILPIETFLAILLLAGSSALLVTSSTIQSPSTLVQSRSVEWAGYTINSSATSASTVTLESDWIVPSFTCLNQFTLTFPNDAYYFLGLWTGLDTVGISMNLYCYSQAIATPIYFMLYGNETGSYTLPTKDAIAPGDSIHASLSYSYSTHLVRISIKDVTKSWSFKSPKKFEDVHPGNLAWAWWIFEGGNNTDPASSSTLIENFTTIKTSGDEADFSGVQGSIGSFSTLPQFNVTQWSPWIDNSNSHSLATASSLSRGGSSFTLSWVQAN